MLIQDAHDMDEADSLRGHEGCRMLLWKSEVNVSILRTPSLAAMLWPH